LLQISSIKNDIISWKEAIALTRNQLAALLGAGPERGQQIPASFADKYGDYSSANLPLELISRRPDIVAARWRVEAGQSEIDLAKNQFYPTSISSDLPVYPAWVWIISSRVAAVSSAGPTIRLPIFEVVVCARN
jgi:outer membrane protein TolC